MLNPPMPERYLFLGRADVPPSRPVGQQFVLPLGNAGVFYVTVTKVDDNGDLHVEGGGKKLVGVWARVLDNEQGITLTCWRWRDDK